jgi:hypothetical protein
MHIESYEDINHEVYKRLLKNHGQSTANAWRTIADHDGNIEDASYMKRMAMVEEIQNFLSEYGEDIGNSAVEYYNEFCEQLSQTEFGHD